MTTADTQEVTTLCHEQATPELELFHPPLKTSKACCHSKVGSGGVDGVLQFDLDVACRLRMMVLSSLAKGVDSTKSVQR